MKGAAICSGRAAAKIAAPGLGGSIDQLSARTYDIKICELALDLVLTERHLH
jgi:hypothetical protein